MKKKNYYFLSIGFVLLSVIFALITLFADVTVYSDTGKEIGCSLINIKMHNLTGVHILWYDITDIMGIISIGFGLIFAFAGLVQLIKRKSFLKVDIEIYGLGIIYVLLGIIYAAFEKIALNCRPVIMEGETEAEASFPSSHTLLICAIMITGIIAIHRLVKSDMLKKLSTVFCSLFAAVGLIGRFYSGVHWFTDIIESLIITAALVFFYCGFAAESTGKHSS